MEIVYTYYLAIARYLIAFFSITLAILWIVYFKKTRLGETVFAELTTTDGVSIPITSKENIIGRTKRADILIPLGNVHTKHALLYIRKNRWFLAPLDGKVSVNLQNLSQPAPLDYGDKISIAKQTLTFKKKGDMPTEKGNRGAIWQMLVLTAVQLMVFLEIMLKFNFSLPLTALFSFCALLLGEWIYYIIGLFINHFKMLVEIPVLFMSTFGLAVGCSVYPETVFKQTICFLAGFLGYILITILLRFPELCQKLQKIAMLFSLVLLYYTAFFGTITSGSRNWLTFGSFSFQPSELCKPIFVFCGGATLFNVLKKPRIKTEFFIYSLLVLGSLAIMYDFGAVAIFFAGMLVVLTLYLAKPVLIFSITGTAALGTVALTVFFPYIARRFGAWLHSWEFANSIGFQQTRTMIASGSGGLLGVGAGNGHLSSVSAADTDLVFGILSEEWGGVSAVLVALCVVAISIYALRLAKNADSAFYSIPTLCAVGMIIFQSALNIFGSLDLLPLTGVTLIFVSRGGTSVISALIMMAFLKATELYKKPVSQWRYEDEVD